MSDEPKWPTLAELGIGVDPSTAMDLTPTISGANWMPIDTAPKDGSFFLARDRAGHHGDCRWFAHHKIRNKGSWIWPSYFAEPTHWMPLPSPPEPLP